jgi:hypothetical protein
VAANIVSLLAPFEEITRDISGNNASISLVIPAIKALSTFLDRTDRDTGIKKMKADLLDSIKTRFGNVEENAVFSVATLLDPRFKVRCFSTVVAAAQAKASLLLASKRFVEVESSQSDNTSSIIEPTPKKMRSSSSENAQNESPWDCLDEILSGNSQTAVNSIHLSTDNEMLKYLAEGLLSRKEDPLEWWRINKHQYPNMASLARIYLAPPPTSVPSERVFSTAGDVITDHRAKLLPENAEKLILLKFNYHNLNHES